MPRRKLTEAEREASKERRRKYERERNKRRRREAGYVPPVPLTDAEKRERHRLWKREWRAKNGVAPAAPRPSTPKSRKAKVAKVAGTVPHMTPTRKPAPKRAPADLRRAWRQAHENSVLKQKYPTVAKLDEAFRKGELNVPAP